VKRNHVVLSSPGKVEAIYFRHTAELCRSIGETGLLRRSDYGTRLASLARPSVRLPWIEFGEVDIGVAVGAAGEVYRFASGKHRTAAAQVLKIRSMPVEIRMVHADWLVRQMEDTGLAPVGGPAPGHRNPRARLTIIGCHGGVALVNAARAGMFLAVRRMRREAFCGHFRGGFRCASITIAMPTSI
jgi:hypothetical protein